MDRIPSLFDYEFLKGGPGSGHHGHSGRPGQRGGSTSDSEHPQDSTANSIDRGAVRNSKNPKVEIDPKAPAPKGLGDRVKDYDQAYGMAIDLANFYNRPIALRRGKWYDTGEAFSISFYLPYGSDIIGAQQVHPGEAHSDKTMTEWHRQYAKR